MDEAKQAREPIKHRFCAVIAARIREEEIPRQALHFKVSESTIRNWKNGAHAPKNARKRQEVYRALGVPHHIEAYSEAEWTEFSTASLGPNGHETPSMVPPEPTGDKPTWLHYPDDLRRVETSVHADATIIVMTLDAEDDTSVPNVREVVQSNLARGLNYLYVIPQDCQKKDDLIRFARSVGRRSRSDGLLGKRGAINIMVVQASIRDIEWSLTDYAWFVTKPSFVFSQESIANIEVDDVDQGFEQLYKSSDVLPPDHLPATPHRRIWVWISHRRQAHFLKLMRRWHAGAKWVEPDRS